MIRILLVDDQTLVRECIGRLFWSEPDIEVAGQCDTPEDAVRKLSGLKVDVLVAAARLGPQLIAAARGAGCSERIVLIAGKEEPQDPLSALNAGASAILYRDTSPDALARAVRLVASGSAWVDQRTIAILSEGRPPAQPEPLSERETRVLNGVAEGLTNRKIAVGLDVSEGTVKGVLRRLFRKTGTRSRVQLARLALERFGLDRSTQAR